MRQPVGLPLKLASYVIGQKLAGIDKYAVVMMLEPLHTCNLSCIGCPPERWARPKSEWMSLEECFESVDECGAPIVSICGGEPLIYKDIVPLTQGIVKRGKYAILCTNAICMPAFLKKMPYTPKLSFAVHIDGMEKTHDWITKSPGCWKKAIEATKQAKKAGWRTLINCTVYAQSSIDELVELFRYVQTLKVDGILVSAGYDYDHTGSDLFMKKQMVHERFRKLLSLTNERWYGNSSLYLQFLKGDIDLDCTAWGNPTRTPKGWQGPCYMISDGFYKSYHEMVNAIRWENYGPKSGNPKCVNCMMHCGFEPTVASGRGIPLKQQIAGGIASIV